MLNTALKSNCAIVFLLNCTILDLADKVKKFKDSGKYVFLHLDLIDGLSSHETAVDGVKMLCEVDGIISTRAQQIKRAKKLGMVTVQRTFVLDSRSLKNIELQVSQGKPDYLEILPGIAPTIISKVRNTVPIPVIAGGMITTKTEVINAISAGAIAVSSSNSSLWNI